nr:MAG TPA: hypothetical protein [Caudoviricetes sp.]
MKEVLEFMMNQEIILVGVAIIALLIRLGCYI